MCFRASRCVLRPLAISLSLLVVAARTSRSQDAPAAAPPAIEMRVVAGDSSNSPWIVKLPDGSQQSLAATGPGVQGRDLVLNQATASLLGTNSVVLRARAEVTFAFPDVAGLRVTMPAGAALHVSPVGTSTGLDLICATNSAAASRVELPDGAVLELRCPAAMRCDALANGTYYVTGQGGAVLTTADGQRVEGSALEEPWTGGALRTRPTSTAGSARLERASPTILLTIDGGLDAEVRVQGPGNGAPTTLRAGVQERLAFENGAVMVFQHDGTRHTLVWQVEKGLFEMAIAGAGTARFLGMTGQSGEFVFDQVARMFDVHNPMPSGNLLVRLPGPVTAHVGPNATFQFAPVDATSFAATGVGGTVRLTSARQGIDQLLPGTRILVRNGVLRSVPTAANPAATPGAATATLDGGTLNVAWPSPAATIEVSGQGGTVVLQPGAEHVLTGPANAAVELTAPSKGKVVIRSEQARYRILPAPVAGFSVELDPGATIEIEFQSQARALILHAPAANSIALRAAFADGFAPLLDPGSTLTVWPGDGRFADGLAAGGLVFFEPAGAAGAESFGAASTRASLRAPDSAPPLTQLDVSRLPQRPVSPEQ